MGHRGPSEGFASASCDTPYLPLSLLPQSRKESLSVGYRWEGRQKAARRLVTKPPGNRWQNVRQSRIPYVNENRQGRGFLVII